MLRRSVLVVCVLGAINALIFALLGDTNFVLEKQEQFVAFLKAHDFVFVNEIARFLHSKCPLLEPIPYLGRHDDSRVSTWYSPPQQVVIEWTLYMTFFVWILLKQRGETPFRAKIFHAQWQRICLFAVFQTAVWTLLFTAHFKVQAGVKLGQWFNVLYLLQPCHLLILLYAIMTLCLQSPDKYGHVASRLMTFLWDLQWFTWFAIIFPDIRELSLRNFFGELFMFHFEHIALAVFPFVCVGLFFDYEPGKKVGWRVLSNVAWAGAVHMQIFTPLSLLTGTQVHYQTHLPKFAIKWALGRAFKAVLLCMYFGIAFFFAKIVEPTYQRLLR